MTRSAHRRRRPETARLEREILACLRDAAGAEQERRYFAILEALDAPATRTALTTSVSLDDFV